MQSTFKIENKEINYSINDLEVDQFTIQSIPFNYTVRFVDDKVLNTELKKIAGANKAKHFVFIDNAVASFHGQKIFKNQKFFTLAAKETNKALPTVTKLIDKLLKNDYTKKEIFLSAGGGITQDVSSFARAAYKRGIQWVYLPTTLLAMGDSCIGAKACLNYKGVKNLLGLFSAPREILIHTKFLDTLSNRDILSGYGEIVKLAIVGGKASIEIFNKIKIQQQGNHLRNIDQMIKLSLLVKKSVIEVDEYEHNVRKALNYGHTVGHAIEPLVNYKIPHGIAISIGMIIENQIAVKWGALSESDADEINRLINPYIDQKSLGYLKKLSPKDVIKNMMRDKKTLNNDIYLSVPSRIGHFDMLKVTSDKALQEFLSTTFKTFVASR